MRLPSSWRVLLRMPGFSVRHTQLYRGYAVYAVITKQLSAVSGASAT